jgi:hypothetical protein
LAASNVVLRELDHIIVFLNASSTVFALSCPSSNCHLFAVVCTPVMRRTKSVLVALGSNLGNQIFDLWFSCSAQAANPLLLLPRRALCTDPVSHGGKARPAPENQNQGQLAFVRRLCACSCTLLPVLTRFLPSLQVSHQACVRAESARLLQRGQEPHLIQCRQLTLCHHSGLRDRNCHASTRVVVVAQGARAVSHRKRTA